MQQLLRLPAQGVTGASTLPHTPLQRARSSAAIYATRQHSSPPALHTCRCTSTTVSAAAPNSASHPSMHPLWQRVLEVYDQAQASGAATKTDTKIQLFEDGGITFVLRLASALKAKPKGLCGGR